MTKHLESRCICLHVVDHGLLQAVCCIHVGATQDCTYLAQGEDTYLMNEWGIALQQAGRHLITVKHTCGNFLRHLASSSER